MQEIIGALFKQARKGDVQAAREYRAWLDKYPPEDHARSIENLEEEEVERALAWVLKQLEEESPANEQKE